MNSLRGLIYFQVDVTGPNSDLHSGTWGGSLANPNEALVQALSKMKDSKTGIPQEAGDVVVEATLDAVRRVLAQ